MTTRFLGFSVNFEDSGSELTSIDNQYFLLLVGFRTKQVPELLTQVEAKKKKKT